MSAYRIGLKNESKIATSAFLLVMSAFYPSCAQDLPKPPAEIPLITSNPEPWNDFREFVRPSPPERTVTLIRFASPIETKTKENNVVEAEIWIPRDAPRPMPVVVLLHYWGASDFVVEERFAKELNFRGIAAVMMTLPYHMRRSPSNVASGAMAIRPDTNHLREGLTQAVFDIKRLVDYLSTKSEFDMQRLGISGVSLGAIVASLVYNVEPRFRCAAIILGGGDIAHIIWNSSFTVDIRTDFRKKGYTEEQLREELRPVEPLEYVDPHREDNVLIIGAKYDEVIPPESTQKLIDAYGNARVVWLTTGHFGGALVERKLFRTATGFFESKFFAKTFEIPSTISAPTLRLGVVLVPDYELTIAAGMDLWRPKRLRNVVVNGWVTPEGPLLWANLELEGGFGAGFALTKERLTFGIGWSVVL